VEALFLVLAEGVQAQVFILLDAVAPRHLAALLVGRLIHILLVVAVRHARLDQQTPLQEVVQVVAGAYNALPLRLVLVGLVVYLAEEVVVVGMEPTSMNQPLVVLARLAV
jgi:hypothetical protein